MIKGLKVNDFQPFIYRISFFKKIYHLHNKIHHNTFYFYHDETFPNHVLFLK
jgi:hypothetical protein